LAIQFRLVGSSVRYRCDLSWFWLSS